jgi:branched-subunit amino acid aminotransferase/4-amino-4-deoxychorismate lyase
MTQIKTASMVWYNGTIVPKEKLNLFFDISLFMSTNLVETFFTNGTEIMFLEDTLARIKSFIAIYKFDSKLINDNKGETFINETRRLLIRNFCYKTSRCFLLFCEGSGNNITNEFLFVEPFPSLFSDGKTLKRAIVSSKFLKPLGNVMNLPTIEHEFRKIIHSEFKIEDVDDCIIINQEQFIVESFFGNIFLVDQQKVKTPSANSGCSLPIMRNVIINGFKALNFQVIEMDQISVEALFETKEVIIAGSSGIYSLKGIEYKRYFDITRKILIEKIVSGS